ncbi:MAG: hypothetical protein KGI91_10210 [Burkholderiales bacterium]|nr:hypothetical protein [Burkholderiales bacterium]
MNGRRLGPAVWALLDQAVVSASNFLSGVLIARSLHAEGLAAYSLAVTSVFGLFTVHRALIAQPFNILGVQESVARRWGRFQNMMRAQWVVLPVTCAVLALVGAWFFPRWALVVGGMLYVTLYCLQEIVRRFHYTDGQIVRALPGDVLGYGGQLLALLCAWQTDTLSIDTVLWWMSVPLGLATTWMYFGIRREHTQPVADATPAAGAELAGHWDFAKWVVLSQLVWIGATQLIPFQLSIFAAPDAVAAFYAANTLMNGLNVIRLTMGNYLPTRAAAILAADGKLALRRYLWRVGAGVLVMSAVGWLAVWWLGGWAVALIFSGKYPQAGAILPTLAAVNLLALLALVFAAGAQILGVSRVMFTSNLLAMCLCLAAGPWLASHEGLWGAVAISAIGLLLPTLMQGIQVNRALKS